MLDVLQHVNSIFNSVSYIIVDKDASECVVIDVGDADTIMDMIKEYSIKAIFLTHIHYDHMG